MLTSRTTSGNACGAMLFARCDVSRISVFAVCGFGIGFDAAVLAGGNPHFGDGGAGVCGQFGAAVVVNARIGDLDEQQDIGWSGVSSAVEVVAPPQQHNVGLRLAVVVSACRIRLTTARGCDMIAGGSQMAVRN